MNRFKILSIVLASLFLFGCSSETSSSSQPEQSSVPAPVSSASEVQSAPSSSVPSSSTSVSSSQSVPDQPIYPTDGPIPQMLEKGWHYTSPPRRRYGWVRDGQEFVICHDSMFDFYSLDNQFLRSVPFDGSRLSEDYWLYTTSNRIFLWNYINYDVPKHINKYNDGYMPFLYEKDGQEYLSGVTILDLEGNILLQLPSLDASQDESGDFHFSLEGEPVSMEHISHFDIECVNDDLIFLSLEWLEKRGDEKDYGLTSHVDLYYFVPSKNKLTCIGKDFEDGYVEASNRTNACIFFYRYESSGLGYHLGYLDQNGIRYPYPGMIFSDAAMDGDNIYLSYWHRWLPVEKDRFWRTTSDSFLLHEIPFPEMEGATRDYIPWYRTRVHLIDGTYMQFNDRAFNIVTGEYGTEEQTAELYYITGKLANYINYNVGKNSHYVSWAAPRDSSGQFYFKIIPIPKTTDEKLYTAWRNVEDILEKGEDYQWSVSGPRPLY